MVYLITLSVGQARTLLVLILPLIGTTSSLLNSILYLEEGGGRFLRIRSTYLPDEMTPYDSDLGPNENSSQHYIPFP